MEFARKAVPLLDDWVDKHPDAWDYEVVLKDNEVTIAWCDQMTSDDGTTLEPMPQEFCGWGFYWKHGCIHIGQCTKIIARKAAAIFVSLWLRGVSASFCDKLMDGYICFLERQEETRLTFLAEIKDGWMTGINHFLVTRENLCRQSNLTFETQDRIITALGPVAADEEIIVTFSKRRKCP